MIKEKVGNKMGNEMGNFIYPYLLATQAGN